MRALPIRVGLIRVQALHALPLQGMRVQPHQDMRAPQVQTTRVQPLQGMLPPYMLLRDTWATGSISIAIFPSRTRSGFCEATPISGASTRQTSSG